MRKIIWIAAFILLSGLLGPVYAGEEAQREEAAASDSPSVDIFKPHRVVTPYGDFCPRCSRYGVGTRPVVHAEAVAAMHAYFHAKGLSIQNVRKMGRFMMVDVYQKGTLVDTVIFDRRTGRLRSIY